MQHNGNNLLALISEGNEEAFTEFFHGHISIVHSFVARLTKDEFLAREIAQDVFLKVWIEKEQICSHKNPLQWVYGKAYSASLNYRRTCMVEDKLRQMQHEDRGFPGNMPDDNSSRANLRSLITEGAAKLSGLSKPVFILRWEKGFSRKQISADLNIPENTVSNQLLAAYKCISDHIRQSAGIYVALCLIVDYIRLLNEMV